MSIFPKKVKFKKMQSLSLKPVFRYSPDSFGYYSMVRSEPGRITARQLESVRRVLSRGIGRQGKVWFKVFPHIPQTDKPKEARIGKGKGSVDYWFQDVPAGTIVLELSGVSLPIAVSLISKASHKLGMIAYPRVRDIPVY